MLRLGLGFFLNISLLVYGFYGLGLGLGFELELKRLEWVIFTLKFWLF